MFFIFLAKIINLKSQCMNKSFLLISLFFISAITLIAQPTIDWQRSLGGARFDKINAVIRTSDGGYLAVGQTASTTVQGRLDSMEAAVIRLNTEGVILWQKTFGGTGIDIANGAVQLPNGTFAIVGESTTISPTQAKTGNNAWILTADDKGTLLKQYIFGGSNDERFTHVQLLTSNTVVAVGTSNSNDGDLKSLNPKGGKDVLLVRFGIVEVLPISPRLFGGTGDDEGISLVVSSDSTVVVAATSNSGNGDVVENKGNSDIWAFEIGLGGIRWKRSLGGKNNEKAADIIKNTDGYLLVGSTTSTDGDVKGFKGISDIWAVQLDTKGTLLRQNCIGGKEKDEAAAIVADTVDKTYVIIGSTESKNGYVLSPHGATDWSVSKIDGTLKVLWHKCLGGSKIDNGCDIALAKDGGLLAVGASFSNDGNVINGEPNGNAWLVKLNRKNLSFYDDRQLIIRFRDGFTRDSALFYQKFYKAKQINNKEDDITCAGLLQLWQVDSFPVILPNGDTLKDIVEVADGVRGQPKESNGEPNYAFTNGLDVDSIYTTPAVNTLNIYGQDSSNLLKPCERIGRDSALILAIIDSGIDTVPTGHALHAKYLWKNLKEGAQGSTADLDANGYKGDKIGWDFVENDAFPYDQRGHGSHVTGIIDKMLETHRGDSVKLMILKIFDADGSSSLYNLARALTYAICNNANVVNMSLSYTADSKLITTSVIKFLIDFGGTRQKMLAVAAAGNYATDLDAAGATERFCPAYFDSKNLLVVGSVSPDKTLSSFSNYGKVSVDVASYGVNIFSTLQNNKWGFLTGTSMATPFVSASAALIGIKRCSNPFDFNTVKTSIENTVITTAGLAPIRKQGYVNFCNARQNFLNTLPASCLVSVVETPSVLTSILALPNPFSEEITIQLTSTESVESRLIVTNAIGKTMSVQTTPIQRGDNTISLKTNTLSNGLYFISIKIGDKIATLKLVKM
jgi:Subtilase family/Secretion system C-terminal sorting domain